MSTNPVVIIPHAEYTAMEARIAELERILDTSHTTGQAGRDLAEEFLRHFRPAQMPPSWGHVAFCIERALEVRCNG